MRRVCAFLDHAVTEGFIVAAHRGMQLSDPSPLLRASGCRVSLQRSPG